jgi:hypothetical protein
MLLSKEEELSPIKDVLVKHNISPNLRARMVDWMLEVVPAMRNSTQTFFQSVRLLDTFLSKSVEPVMDTEIHLLGSVCMFVASKFHDVNCLHIDNVRSVLLRNEFRS